MTETNPGDLPLAGGPATPQLAPPPQPSLSIPELADMIASGEDAVVLRTALVTAVELTGSRRVQIDAASTTWVSRLQDATLTVGDRVSVLQSGSVMLVIGRLTGSQPDPIGVMAPFGGATAPIGWLLCDGSSVLRATYPALFTAIGTTYGSADGTHFNLPDLRNRLPMGAGGTYALGSTGSGSVTLSSGNLPSHNHSLSGSADSAGSHGHSLSGSVGSVGDHSHSDSFGGSRSDLLAGGGSGAATSGGGSTGSAGGHSHSMSGSADSGGSHSHSLSGSVGSTGSGTSFTTTGPYTAVNYIIRAL